MGTELVTETSRKTSHLAAVVCHRTFHWTIILPIVLYGCETWSPSPKEKHILRLCESTVRREVLGPEKEEVRGERRKQHNEELHELYNSANVTMVIRLRSRDGQSTQHVWRTKMYADFWLRNLKKREYLKYRGVGGRIILKCALKE